MRSSQSWLGLALVLPLDMFCEALVRALLEALQAPSAVLGPLKGSHESGSALLGVLAADLPLSVFLKMLALRAFVVVPVRFQIGLADPQLASGVRGRFDGCLPLAEAAFSNLTRGLWARSRFSPGRAVVTASLSPFDRSAMGLRVTERVSIQ